MSVNAKATLVFIPFPSMSHLVSAVETAKLLTARDESLIASILVMKLPSDTKISSYTETSPHPRINFLHIQQNKSTSPPLTKNRMLGLVESHKGPARDAITAMMQSQDGRLAAFMLDMFTTPMIDVAYELAAPPYIFFPCGSASLGLMLHLQSLHDDRGGDMREYGDSDAAIHIPTHVNPVPAKVWPARMFDKDIGFLDFVRRYKESRGFVINTFLELESHAITSLSADEKFPPVYPVGPMIQSGGGGGTDEIIVWLDEQPRSSVVFLCFGTKGWFEGDQVKEIAAALERSGVRFLWSLRKPPPKDTMESPGEYENPEQVLPQGFLERSMGVGKVIGWAPQVAVLSHPAVGGFVSHCGWNSTLESVWCGVPVAAWPLSAEQQANAFLLIKELEMAVEIKMDYRKSSDVIVDAETIEAAIRQLMDPENKIRLKVKEMREQSITAVVQGGSSYNYLGRLIENVMENNF
ncbi:anthocyanidin 3-O-glucosyltransferase 2-like [Salvia hispanica]|uniref:anthocyanidin 3-O-glucosyltransferase 2-like n=1 Tax=Salvia hispanica TaxID=49212 RepID=UPI002008FC6E|nr:anthocyanidin 3-O-glucosyltransferase 2-like [Salvia hispanica]